MAKTFRTRPSKLAGIKDDYVAWCIDQAIAEYIARIRAGHKLRPPETSDNAVLIRKMSRKKRGG